MIGKLLGAAVGVIGILVVFPLFQVELPWQQRLGFALWYVLVGAVIGLADGIKHLAMFNCRLSPLVRGALLAAKMNFVLALIALPTFVQLTAAIGFAQITPLWIVIWGMVEGAIFGAIAEILMAKFSK